MIDIGLKASHMGISALIPQDLQREEMTSLVI